MNNIITEVDITIVGAGAIGASLALALAEVTSLNIALVDSASEHADYQGAAFDPRVVALSPATINLLDKIGVWPDVVAARACPYFSMEVWDGEGSRGRVQFDCSDNHEPVLGYIVENTLLVKALWQKIDLQQRIRFFKGYELAAAETGRISISSAEKAKEKSFISLVSPLIIAADGAHSLMRRRFGIPVREWDYHQSAIVCTVRSELAHAYTCRQRFTKTGPIAFLPLSVKPYAVASNSENYSSLVWSIDEGEASYIMSLSDKAFCEQLTRAFEGALGRVETASERFCFPLRQRHATHYVQPGFALVGDAAHTVHPLAGQGANLGFADVTVLADEIERAINRQVPLEHFSLLQRYQRRRKSHNLAAMAVMEGFKRLFGSDDLALRWLRNTGMQVFNSQFWLKQRVAQLAAGRY